MEEIRATLYVRKKNLQKHIQIFREMQVYIHSQIQTFPKHYLIYHLGRQSTWETDPFSMEVLPWSADPAVALAVQPTS